MHWWTAQCSLSTGISSAPGVARNGCTTGPAAIKLSLFASASRFPAVSVATVTGRPAKPTTPFTTTSAGSTRAARSSTTSANGKRGRDLGAPVGIGDGDEPRTELQRLGDQRLDRRPDAEPDHLVGVGVGSHDVERLRADRTRRAGDRDPDRRHVGDPAAIGTDRAARSGGPGFEDDRQVVHGREREQEPVEAIEHPAVAPDDASRSP